MFGPTKKFCSRLLITALSVTALSVVGCGPDDPARFSVVITSDSTSLVEDGSNFATITVSVLDQRGNPPEIGSPVALVLPQGGVLATTEEAQGVSATNATGTATFQIVCQPGVPQVIVAASFDGSTEIMPQPILCTAAPTGNWTVEILSRESDAVGGSTASTTFRALQDNGAPVPIGTSFIATITVGNLTFLNGQQTLAVRSATGTGEFSVSVRLPEDSSPGTLCVQYADTRFSDQQACARFGDAGRGCFASFSPTNIPADGSSVANLAFTVIDSQGTPVSDAAITANITEQGVGGLFVENSAGGSPANSKTLTTDRNGTATTLVQAGELAGSPQITATTSIIDFIDESDPNSAQGEVPLTCQFDTGLIFEPPPSCRFEPVETADGGPLGVSGSIFANNAQITACFTRINGDPVVGEAVTFSLDAALAGYAFAPAIVQTGADGCAATQLQTGDVAGIITVRAELGTGSFAETCFSDPLPVSSGLPSASNTTLFCGPQNLSGFTESNGSQSLHTCETTCEMLIRDRFLNVLSGERFSASLFTETGYTVPPQSPDDNGRIVWNVGINGDHPLNTTGADNADPLGPGLSDSARCQLDVCPRDGIIQVIALIDGEEEYFDANGNGTYDEGEKFVDLAEPFIDSDNNGVFTANDPITSAPLDRRFWDVSLEGNTPGEWDGPNQQWDELTKVFIPAHITSSGLVDPQRTLVEVTRGTGSAQRATFTPGSGYSLSLLQTGDFNTITVEPRDSRDMPLGSETSITIEISCPEGKNVSSSTLASSANDSAGVTHTRTFVPVDRNGVAVPALSPFDHYQVRWDINYDDFLSGPSLTERVAIETEEGSTAGACSGTLTFETSGAGTCSRDNVVIQSFPLRIL